MQTFDRVFRIAVIIASKNRYDDLCRCLDSVNRQTFQPAQVIVVDQSRTRYDLRRWGNVEHYYDPALSGSAIARNVGIAVCDSSTDLAFFIDDDVELRPESLERLAVAVYHAPDVAGFQCRDLLSHHAGLSHNLLKTVFERGFFDTTPYSVGGVTWLRWLEGFAMAVPFRLLRDEQFDEALTGYALGEDWEFSQRLRRHGPLTVANGADVYHHVSQTNRLDPAAIARLRWQNFNYFFRKHEAARSPINRFWYAWWAVGESVRWLRNGLGLPRFQTAKFRKHLR